MPQHIWIMLRTVITSKTYSVFFYLYVFNNFVKFYGYCKVRYLEVPASKVILVSRLFFIYNLLVWSYYSNCIKECYNFFDLSMLIDNGTWQARVGIFYILKPFIKCKSKTWEFPFPQHPGYFSLMLIFYFGKFLLEEKRIRWKNFINPSCPKHPKMVEKKWHKFLF